MSVERRESIWAEIGIAVLAGAGLIAVLKRKRPPNLFDEPAPSPPRTGQPIGNRTHHLIVYYDTDATPPSWAVVPKRINFFALGDGRNHPFTLRWRILGKGPGGQDVVFPLGAVAFRQANNQFSTGIVEQNGKTFSINNINTVDQEFDYNLCVQLSVAPETRYTVDPTVKNGPTS